MECALGPRRPLVARTPASRVAPRARPAACWKRRLSCGSSRFLVPPSRATATTTGTRSGLLRSRFSRRLCSADAPRSRRPAATHGGSAGEPSRTSRHLRLRSRLFRRALAAPRFWAGVSVTWGISRTLPGVCSRMACVLLVHPDVLLVCAHGVCRLVLPSRPRGERVTSPWRDLERGRTGLPGDRGTDGWNTHTLRGFLIRLCPKSWTNRIVRSNNAGSHQGVRWTGATPVFGTDHRSDLNAACAFFAHLSRRLADTGFGRPSSRGPNR